MEELRNKQIMWLTVLIAVMAWAGWWIMTSYFVEQAFANYAVIPVSYFIAGIALVIALYKTDKVKPQRLAQVYLLMHTLKLVVFGVIALVFVFGFGIKSKLFMLIYAAYYLVFIVFETLCYYSVEKYLKKHAND